MAALVRRLRPRTAPALLIGYLVACRGDDADDGAQRRALAEAGCEQVVGKQPSAEDSGEQPALCGLLARLHAGDVVVVARLDSLGRSVADVVLRMQHLTAIGAGLHSLAEPLDSIAPQDEQQGWPGGAWRHATDKARPSGPDPSSRRR